MMFTGVVIGDVKCNCLFAIISAKIQLDRRSNRFGEL